MSISLTMLDQIIGFIFSFSMMQILNKYKMNTDYLLTLRICYALSISINILILYYIKKRIKIEQDTRTIKIPRKVSFFNNDENEEDIEITHHDFDMEENSKLIKMCMVQAVLISLGHMKWGMVQPLFIQIFGVFKMLMFSPLFLCYIRNYEIVRPYDKNLFMGLIKKDTKKKKED